MWSVYIKVADADLNPDGGTAQTVDVTVTTTTGDSETVTLTETGADTGVFTGQLSTAYGTSATGGDNTLQAQGSDTVTVTYTDALDSAGRIMFGRSVLTRQVDSQGKSGRP